MQGENVGQYLFYKKGLIMKLVNYFFAAILFVCPLAAAEPNESEKQSLEKEVQSILKLPNVDQRKEVEKIFRLGDIYNQEKNSERAIYYYSRGLQVEAWNLAYQLKLAELYKQTGNIEQAREKAKLVYDYAEDEELVIKAKSLFSDLAADTPQQPASIPETISIGLVPIGTINRRLTDEVIMLVQDEIKVQVVICDQLAFEPGKVDRSAAERHINNIYNTIEEKTEPEQLRKIKSTLRISERSLQEYRGKKKLVLRMMRDVLTESEYKEFRADLAQMENAGQYNAGRLIEMLAKQSDLHPVDNVFGYVGIINKDIYENDYNFLFGYNEGRHGVMSYYRFTAEFNDTQPDRSVLRARYYKQLVSSIFHLFGIPRCTSPLCVRAYPNNLEEHDKKTLEICSWCQEQLKAQVQKNKK